VLPQRHLWNGAVDFAPTIGRYGEPPN
jgi:hypothetical protein